MKHLFSIILLSLFSLGMAQRKNFEKIPFELTPGNNIKVKAVLNYKDSLFLTFDTGAIDFYLTKDAIKKYLNPKGVKLTMADISDENFRIGNMEWNHQQIYPVEIAAQETEGMFGWNMFGGKVLEINYDENLMTVHAMLPKKSRNYEKFGMEVLKEHFLINLEIAQDDQKIRTKFLFDTGFQKGLVLDNNLLARLKFPTDQLQVLKTTVLHNSNNEEIPLNTVNVKELWIGKYKIQNVSAELNTQKKPAGYETNYIGSEILKRFNIIIDFKNQMVYMKPNRKYKSAFNI